jgi:hypothetical protein
VLGGLLGVFLPGAAARADVSRARAIAAVQRTQLARVLEIEHPSATLSAAHSEGAWTVTLHAPGSAAPLSSWTVDAASGKVLGGSALALPAGPRLTAGQATRLARASPKIADWIHRYHGVTTSASEDSGTGRWTVHFFAGGQEIAQAVIVDSSGLVESAWTGPQVAWKMARGYSGAFGRRINDPVIWLALCGAFLLGLADWRRPLSLLNVDLLVLLSFSISLAYFNFGLIFWSVPLSYPPLLYLLGRMTWIGFRGRARRGAFCGRLPVLALAGACVFLIGFRGGLNRYDSNVIDVGYAGVIGAERLLAGTIPYGHMPVAQGTPCGGKYSDGSPVGYEQAGDGGRCETANERGDTYGPINYVAYVPAVAALGWTGRWDDLPPAHATAFAFDALAALGLLVIGRRLGGWVLGVALAFAWAAYPFTAYALESNSNDMILAALLIWGFAAATAPAGRGSLLALASWAKFAPLLAVPLWARYPRMPQLAPAVAWPATAWDGSGGGETLAEPTPPARVRRRPWEALSFAGTGRFALGFAIATLAAAAVLVEGGWHALSTFWSSTFGWQLNRPSPFSVWDWGIYPGFPDLSALQTVLKVLLLVGAAALLVVPRRLDAVRLAALTAALLLGFELVLTHWFYLYIPWFFPFVAIALLAPARRL